MDIQILYKDNDVTVAVKPKGVLSEDALNGEKGIIGILSEKEEKPLYLLHRLDRNVSGVMVFANNKKSAGKLSQDIQNHRLKKEYLAVTDGVTQEKTGVLRDLLFKDSKKNRSYVVNRVRKGVKEASLEYEVLEEKEGKALIRVFLHTGRTHQIRVQFSSRKMPLTGDIKYGSKDRTNDDIALFSYRITFNHPVSGEKMTFSALPDCEMYPFNLFGGIKNA